MVGLVKVIQGFPGLEDPGVSPVKGVEVIDDGEAIYARGVEMEPFVVID